MPKLSDYLKNIFFIVILLQVAPPLIKSIYTQYSRILEPQTKVAYLEVKGMISDSNYYTKHLRSFFEQADVKAILMKIETGGGAAGTTECIAHEIELLKAEHPKPVVVFVENICASGGYYIACTSDYIFSAPSALIGSIGSAIPYQFKVNELLRKYDIQYIPITAGTYKGATDPFNAENSNDVQMLQKVANDSYANFKEHVIKHRSKLSTGNEKEWADAQIFTGRQALKIGLIDEVGSQTNAIKKIKEMAIIEGEIEWIKPTKPSSFASLFSNEEESSALHSMVHNLSNIFQRISDLLIK